MEFKLMMNENVMIGTAILSTFADKKQSDSIDLSGSLIRPSRWQV